MAARPTARWNEQKQRWMAWVRFPDGTRRKVERISKHDALTDLDQLLALCDDGLAAAPSRTRLATFDEILDAWFEAGCPNVSPTRKSRHARDKSPNTIASARQVLDTHVRPVIGRRRVDRTGVEELEAVFQRMADRGRATSTVTHAWNYLNQACQHALRARTIARNVAPDVLLPKVAPSKKRKSLTREQAEKMVFEVIPESTRPAMWLTGLMSGLRPGELAVLRWPFVELESVPPTLTIMERAARVGDKYVGQAVPKTEGSKRRLELHPLNAAALVRHRDEQKLLGLYDAEGLVFDRWRAVGRCRSWARDRSVLSEPDQLASGGASACRAPRRTPRHVRASSLTHSGSAGSNVRSCSVPPADSAVWGTRLGQPWGVVGKLPVHESAQLGRDVVPGIAGRVKAQVADGSTSEVEIPFVDDERRL
ncbi:MAG TPA: hypothetical protein VFN21_06085 [Acidimicrobiales bacterium]|nr:hypothetical protein [Acidimicrobiales bacterium]